MTEDKLPDNFYEQLEPFSKNEELKKLFTEKYSEENPPSFELMGKY